MRKLILGSIVVAGLGAAVGLAQKVSILGTPQMARLNATHEVEIDHYALTTTNLGTNVVGLFSHGEGLGVELKSYYVDRTFDGDLLNTDERVYMSVGDASDPDRFLPEVELSGLINPKDTRIGWGEGRLVYTNAGTVTATFRPIYGFLEGTKTNIVPATLDSTFTPSTGGLSAQTPGREYLNQEHSARIGLSTGVYYGARFKVKTGHNSTNITECKIRIWRGPLTNATLVSESSDIRPQLESVPDDTIAHVEFDTPIAGVEGDYVSILFTAGALVGDVVETKAGGGGNVCKYITGAPSTNGADWVAASGVVNFIPIELLSDAPNIASIGDSLVAGVPWNYTYIESLFETNTVDLQIVEKVAANYGWTYRNMALTGDTSIGVRNRLANDMNALNPQMGLVMVGVNDIATAVTEGAYITNMTAIIASMVNNGIKPIVIEILPANGLDDTESAARRSFNVALRSVGSTYGAIMVNCDSTIGSNRVSTSEMDDIHDDFDEDGVHLNSAGYTAVANDVITSIDAYNQASTDAFSAGKVFLYFGLKDLSDVR